jgi:hypothetical protein
MQRISALALTFFAAFFAAGHGARAVARAQSDPLSPLRFLVGDWRAVETSPGEDGTFSFKLAAQDHVIVRTNQANYAATAERPASRHDDLMVIYTEDGSLRADYFDSEGHVIRYTCQPCGPDAAVFVSAPKPREPRYRLTYTAGSDGVLTGSFEIAPPDSPDTFKPYLSWKARKR